jgi:DNA-binding MarR family transcriptional regulator
VRNVTRVSAIRESARTIPSERKLVVIVSEIRRLSRTVTVPLERELKRAGYLSLESYEVLREIHESGDLHLTAVELQARLAVPQHRMSRLIDRLAKEGYVEREKTTPDARSRFVVITDLGRCALDEASSVISAAVRRFFYKKKRK